MKTVLNKTNRSLRIRLSGGKVLHLGPGKRGQIATQDADRESLKSLISAGELELVGEGVQTGETTSADPSRTPDTHGYNPGVGIKRRGDR